MKKYEVHNKLMREGIHEYLKYRMNQIAEHGGPFTLASALEEYRIARQIATRLGISTWKYDYEIEELRKEVEGKK